MKIQNKGAVLVQIAPLSISQPRDQNQSIKALMVLRSGGKKRNRRLVRLHGGKKKCNL